MAAIPKFGNPSLAVTLPPHTEQIPHLTAGENIAVGDLVDVDSNGLVMISDGTAPRGIVMAPAQTGEAVTINRNVRVAYGSGLTPGAPVYAGADGALDDAGTTEIGWCVDEYRIQFTGF